ncbi:unnamed protein product [Amaranthus hypochondriacus]
MITPLLIILISTPLVNAQYNEHTPTSSNFQSSLFVVIGVLSFMFSLTLLLIIYAKYCHTQPSAIHSISRNENSEGMFGHTTRFSGLDKTIVESLPFFRFSSLKGSKQGLQCAVCLAEFEEMEILRLLPKCKHGFHILCVDQWLENHSTCPLCRQKVSIDDLTRVNSDAGSASGKFEILLQREINSQSSSRFSSFRGIFGAKREEQNSDGGSASGRFEVLLQREINSQSSSRFNSFRRILGAKREEETGQFEVLLPREISSQSSSRFSSCRRIFSAKREEHMYAQLESDQDGKSLHRLNHQIIVSDVVFKHRWSDLSSSDLMFLNSRMLGIMSSDRFSTKNNRFDEGSVRNETERKRNFEHKIDEIKSCNSNFRLKEEMGIDDLREINMNLDDSRRNSMIPAEKRSMSEIITVSRFKNLMSMKNKLRHSLGDSEIIINNDDYVTDEDVINRRKKWFSIAKRTLKWFANRHEQQQQQAQDTSQTIDYV